jgi:hypothetical protein
MFSAEDHRPQDDVFSSARGAAWQELRHAELCEGPGEPAVLHHLDGRCLYRPRQILVQATERPTLTHVANELTRRGGARDEETDSTFDEIDLPVRSFMMPADVHIPSLVSELRQHPALSVAPNHVFTGEPDYHGGPAGEPRSAKPFSEAVGSAGDQPPVIAVLDTGYDPAVQALHPGLYGRLDYDPADVENAVLPDGYLAREGGHGTFIDGIIMRMAPQVRIRQVKVLSPAGVGDDLTVALELARAARAGVKVISLSLGGYTFDDEPPLATALTLAQLGSDVAVVAAAGNNHEERPFWPAAFKRVVSVGALDTRDGTARLAGFSNHGAWVDVYVPGVRILSTYLEATWKLPSDPEPRALDGYAYWSGTSFAAPQVAAMTANALPAAGSARQAVLDVLAQATWIPGLGPALIPEPGVAGLSAVARLSAVAEADQGGGRAAVLAVGLALVLAAVLAVVLGADGG